MKHIRTHLKRVMSRARETERGELMRYFIERLNRSRLRDGLPPVTMGRMGKLLEKIPTKDLYYLKKVCDDAENFSKKFWWLLNPKKHEDGSEDRRSANKKRY
jgi:hypothetical protein